MKGEGREEIEEMKGMIESTGMNPPFISVNHSSLFLRYPILSTNSSSSGLIIHEDEERGGGVTSERQRCAMNGKKVTWKQL